MTEKELKKLNRYQLLELLIVQTERADKLQAQLESVEKQLNDQNIEISSLGSIAAASLQLSGVFRAAQDAADRYIYAAQKRAQEIEEAAQKRAEQIIGLAQAQTGPIKGE